MRAAKFFSLELETEEKQKSDTGSQSEWGHAETRVTQGHRVSGATQRLRGHRSQSSGATQRLG